MEIYCFTVTVYCFTVYHIVIFSNSTSFVGFIYHKYVWINKYICMSHGFFEVIYPSYELVYNSFRNSIHIISSMIIYNFRWHRCEIKLRHACRFNVAVTPKIMKNHQIFVHIKRSKTVNFMKFGGFASGSRNDQHKLIRFNLNPNLSSSVQIYCCNWLGGSTSRKGVLIFHKFNSRV